MSPKKEPAPKVPNPRFDFYHKNFSCESCGAPPEYGSPAYKSWRTRVINHFTYKGDQVHSYPPGKFLRGEAAKRALEQQQRQSNPNGSRAQQFPQGNTWIDRDAEKYD
jgi:hypothetical protein